MCPPCSHTARFGTSPSASHTRRHLLGTQTQWWAQRLRLFPFFYFHSRTSADARTYAVAVVRVLKAGVAETVVGAHRVLTGPVSARLFLTLVHVWNQSSVTVLSLGGGTPARVTGTGAAYRHTSTGPGSVWSHWGRSSDSSPTCRCTGQDCIYQGSRCTRYGLRREKQTSHCKTHADMERTCKVHAGMSRP